MADPTPTDQAPLTEEDQEQRRALTRALRWSDGFALLFARVNVPRRRNILAERLKQEVADEIRVLEMRLTEPVADLAYRIAERLREDAEAGGDGEAVRRAVFVYGLEHSLPSGGEPIGTRRHAPLAVLNFKRELLKETAPVPIVVWLPEFALRTLMEGAPDLWAWRGGLFAFSTPRAETEQTWDTLRDQGWLGEYDGMTLAERRERAATLTALLDEYDARPDAAEPEIEDIRLSLTDRLARLRNRLGDYAGAEPLYRRALEVRERVLGPEHPDTIASVNGLGFLLRAKGDYAGAEPLCRRALEVRERTLGPEHPDTLTSVSHLGILLRSQGDYARAEPFYRRALSGRERVLGADHLATLVAVNNLAFLLRVQGSSSEAESLYRRALEARERVLGPDHPSTLVSVDGLGVLLREQGDYTEAEPLLRRALIERRRVLGLQHPRTLSSTSNLGLLLRLQGDYVGAEPLYRQALEGRKRVLGLEHPATLLSVSNLGLLQEDLGNYPKAESLYRHALEAQERVLGPEHPSTKVTRSNLSTLLKEKGEQG